MASSKPEKAQTRETEWMALSQANNRLAIHLYGLLAEEKKNVFFSPFSISTAMTMLLCAAEGETETEMRLVLGHESAGIAKEDLASLVKRYMEVLLRSKVSYTLSSANCMLTQKDLEVKNDFKTILNESFKALLIEADFQSDSQNVVARINDWVKKKTNNMIPKMVETLDPSTLAVLLNAVYFKGSWQHKFDKERTISQDFYNNGRKDEVKTVNMMHMKRTFMFAELESCQVLQLLYTGAEMKMVIFLPRSLDGLEAMENSFTSSFVLRFCQNICGEKVSVTLPRFRLEYSKSLIPPLQRLGVSKLFCSDAELGAAFNSRDLAVTDIFHKAVLEVNEEGSEAAAATAILFAMSAKRHEPVFTVDHPFVFVIYNTKSNLILFMGRVTEL